MHGWSAQSRLNAWRTCAAVDWEAVGQLCMITLTYRVEPIDGRESKRHLKLFADRWRRQYGAPVGLWKREFQRRGVVHYHLWLRWPVEVLPHTLVAVRRWVRASWSEIVGESLRTSVELWDGSPVRYLSAYLRGRGKEYQHEVPEGWQRLGRWWGLWGVRPEWQQVQVSAAQAVRLKRAIRGVQRSRNRHRKWRQYSRQLVGGSVVLRSPAAVFLERLKGGEGGAEG